MTFFDSILLGIIQGLTEFLPVSSSGHLVLAQKLLGVKQAGVAYEVLLHLGTLLSVVVFFRYRILSLLKSLVDRKMGFERGLLLYLAIGTVPAVIVGLLFEKLISDAFGSPLVVSLFLIVTGIILLIPYLRTNRDSSLSPMRAILIGCGQAIAILPGISRAGSTIAVGMLTGLNPSQAAEFSFLLAIPVIGGAALLKMPELMELSGDLIGPYLAGTAASFLCGLGAVYLVLRSIRTGRFKYFAYYCFAAGSLGLYLFW